MRVCAGLAGRAHVRSKACMPPAPFLVGQAVQVLARLLGLGFFLFCATSVQKAQEEAQAQGCAWNALCPLLS